MVKAGIEAAPALKYVNLSYNMIEPADADALARVLLKSDHLVRMDLNCFVKKSFKAVRNLSKQLPVAFSNSVTLSLFQVDARQVS